MPGSPPTTTSRPLPESASLERGEESRELAFSPDEDPVRQTTRNGVGVGRAAADGGCRGREEIERGILTEDRLLQLHDRPARLEAELFTSTRRVSW